MSSNRKIIGAAAFSLALAGGAAAGALLGTPSLSGAQDGSDDAATEESAAPDGFRRHHRGEGLATAAEVLGMTEEELRTELQDGASIAQVAEERGVDVQAVIDALVADATERLEEMEAALPERMTDLVNRTGSGERGPRGPGHHHPGIIRHLALDTAAETLGLTLDELRTQLEGGATLAEVAEANDVEVQTLIDALVAEASERLDEAVADGRLEADEAEEIKAALTERVAARVNGEEPVRLGFGDGAPEAEGTAA
jgi:hypothetical protein